MSEYFVVFYCGPRSSSGVVPLETFEQSAGCPQKYKQRASSHFSINGKNRVVTHEIYISAKYKELFYDLEADSKGYYAKTINDMKAKGAAILEHTVQHEFETLLVKEGFAGYFNGTGIISFVALPTGKPADAKTLLDWNGNVIEENRANFSAAGNFSALFGCGRGDPIPQPPLAASLKTGK